MKLDRIIGFVVVVVFVAVIILISWDQSRDDDKGYNRQVYCSNHTKTIDNQEYVPQGC